MTDLEKTARELVRLESLVAELKRRVTDLESDMGILIRNDIARAREEMSPGWSGSIR